MSPFIESLPILILSPHGRCNCRCLMCDIWKDTSEAEISAVELDRYIADIKRLSVEWVVFSGGEPLMHSDLFRLCATLRQLGIRTTILSTGLLLERNARRLIEHVDDVIVSLDGPPLVHDRIRRVQGAFEKLARGVRAVHKIDPQFPISARCTIQKENYSFVCETARTAKALGLRSISFLAADLTSEAFNRPGGWDSARQSKVALMQSEIAVLEGQLDELTSEPGSAGFVAESREKLQRIVGHYQAQLGLCAPAAPNCNAPWVSAVVEADGTVRPCFFHRPVGTVNGLSLEQVLNGPEAVQFRRNLDVATNAVCKRCVCSLNWQPIKAGFGTDALSPQAPQPAYYDSAVDGWVLSCYSDVLAALHDTRLCPVDSRASTAPERAELEAQQRLRRETLTGLSRQKIHLWQTQFADLAHSRFGTLRSRTRFDVVGEFAEPWSLTVALIVTEADEKEGERLGQLAREVSKFAADPLNEELRQPAKAANQELAKRLESSPIPMSGPAFVALSQTLPQFLANAWLALLRHPLQLGRLRSEPTLISVAVEELMRYAGLAHTLYRRASTKLNLAGATIEQGARVVLKLSSANRDPLQFPNPDVLDFSRRGGPQLALGTGPHSCAGGSLIRMLAGIATAEFVESVAALDTASPIEWQGGSGFRSPKRLYVSVRTA